jgi:hypothetical protein
MVRHSFSRRLVVLMPPKVPALPREEVGPCLSAGLPAQQVVLCCATPMLRSRCAQLATRVFPRFCKERMLHSTLRCDCRRGVRHLRLGRLENSVEGSKEVEDGASPTHTLLRTGRCRCSLDRKRISIGNFTTQRDVPNFAESEFGKCVTYSWAHSFPARSESRVRRTIVSPEEQT